MNAVVLMLVGFCIFAFGWFVYSKFLVGKVFSLEKKFVTPAEKFNDGSDFLPTNKYVLWGHHFTTVAGAAPIVGPAVALIWGWAPAFIWVTLGTIFFAGLHDMGALAASVRHQGRSIVSIASDLIGKKITDIFMVSIFLLLLMVNAVFALIIAGQLNRSPQAVIPSWGAIVIALIVGQLIYRFKWDLRLISVLALIALYALIPLGVSLPLSLPETLFGLSPVATWIIILFLYAGVASLLPVWSLLQPRDFINGLQLFIALILIYVSVIISGAEISAPVFQLSPAGAPPMIPLLFVTIACGAISGFHGLVSSTLTSKQLKSEPDARFVGYFGAMGEGLLALATILVITSGLSSSGGFASVYQKFGDGGAAAFVQGGASILQQGIGLSASAGQSLLSLMLILFAGTTLDSSLRLQRYLIGEWAERFKIPILGKPLIATLIAVISCALLAFGAGKNGSGGMLLWPVFGISNQLLASLNLLVIGIYLLSRKKLALVALIPMCFVLLMAFSTSLINLGTFISTKNWLLAFLTLLLQLTTLLILFHAVAAIRKFRNSHHQSAKEGTNEALPSME